MFYQNLSVLNEYTKTRGQDSARRQTEKRYFAYSDQTKRKDMCKPSRICKILSEASFIAMCFAAIPAANNHHKKQQN